MDCADVNDPALFLLNRDLRAFLEQFPPDQHAENLGSACTDFVKFGVTQQASARIVVDTTVAAEQLYRINCAWRRFSAALFPA